MAEKLDKTSLDFDTQCDDKDLTYAVLRELQTHGKKHKLEKFEIPGGVTIVKEIWDPESGLVTAAFKLKRRPLQVSNSGGNFLDFFLEFFVGVWLGSSDLGSFENILGIL